MDWRILDYEFNRAYRKVFGLSGVLSWISTQQAITRAFVEILKNAQELKIIDGWQVMCDERNNPPSEVENGNLIVDVLFEDPFGSSVKLRYTRNIFDRFNKYRIRKGKRRA